MLQPALVARISSVAIQVDDGFSLRNIAPAKDLVENLLFASSMVQNRLKVLLISMP
jgi:hypothetical protein